MAKKHANKKPKVKIKNYDNPVIELIQGMFDNLVENITTMENAIKSLDGALSSYIEFKGDAEKWQKWLDEKFKEFEKEAKKSESKSKKS